jgi:hypothetical protein
MDALFPSIAAVVMYPQFGATIGDLNVFRGLGGDAGQSYVDKDLRTLLGDPVRGPFHLQYCGAGSLTKCRAALWDAVDFVVSHLEPTYGPNPSTWLKQASRTGFQPGLIPDTMRTTNRPTFQQVIELQRH